LDILLVDMLRKLDYVRTRLARQNVFSPSEALTPFLRPLEFRLSGS